MPLSTTTGALLVCLLLLPPAAQAQDQPAAPIGPAAAATFNVLVPTDERQQPKGDYWFLPSALYDALNRLAREPVGGGRGVWIESAEYRVSLAGAESTDSRLAARELTVDFAIKTFHPTTRLKLPFRKDRLRIVDWSIDGLPQPVTPTDDEAEWSVVVNSQGARRLRFVFRPLSGTPESAGEFTTAIPICPRSRLVVQAPGAVDRISVPSSVGPPVRDDVAGLISMPIAPVGQVSIQWSEPALVKLEEPAIDTDAAERIWLHVQNNGLTLHARIRFTARTGTLGQVSILADPRLRLVAPARESPIAATDVVPGPRQLIRCWLDRPYRDVTIHLVFDWTANSGLGSWQLPAVEAVATRRTPAWMGINTSEGYVAKLSAAGSATRLAPAEFLAVWGEDRDPPQQAFALSVDSHPMQLEVQPVPTRVFAQENQDLLVSAVKTVCEYEAVVNIEAGRVSHLRLHVPPRFVPRDVIVLHDDANRLLRWARVTDEELTLFLTSPLSGELRLLISGEVGTTLGNRSRLPLLALGDVEPVRRSAQIYQHDEVRVDVLDAPGWQPVLLDDMRFERGRLVKSLLNPQPGSDRPVLELSVRPNRPRVEGSILTMLVWSEDQWFVEAMLRLTVQQGALDEIRIHLPAEMSGQIERSPPGDLQVQPAPGEEGRLLRSRFPIPVDRETTLTFSGELGIPAGAPIRVPELRVLDGIVLKQFVVLPRRVAQQRTLWETSGLQSAELPVDLAGASIPPDAAVFQVVGPRPQAMLREVERTSGTSQVHLVDYHVRWFEGLGVRGLATFYLEPSHLAEIELLMPAEVQPIHFRVAGLPAAGRPIAGNRWRVPVGPEVLPQLVEVLFTGSLRRDPRDGREVVFSAPVITGVPTVQTLWTIQGPPGTRSARPSLTHTESPEQLLDAKRAQTAESLRQHGQSDATRISSSDRDAWFANWNAHLRHIELRNSLRRPLPTSSIPAVNDLSVPMAAGDLVDLWLADRVESEAPTCCMLRGAAPRIGVQYQHQVWGPILAQIGRLAVLIAVASCCGWLLRRQWLRALWTRCPQVVLASIGVIWWLLFVPSVLGLFILLLSAVSAVRTPWKTQAA